MSSAPTHSLQWIYHLSRAQLSNLSITQLISILPNAARSHRARSAAKHIHSPDATEQKRKNRTKRARIESSPVVPFSATGPQEMFAYEFRLDTPYERTGFPRAEECPKYADLPPSYSWSQGTDGHDHLLLPRPVLAYNPEDAFLRLPVGRDWSEHCTQHSHLFPTSMPFPTQRSTYLDGPSHLTISAPSHGLDDSTTRRSEERRVGKEC